MFIAEIPQPIDNAANIAPPWTTVGSGSVGIWVMSATADENNRVLGLGPNNTEQILWRMGHDAAKDADGGWNAWTTGTGWASSWRLTCWVKTTNKLAQVILRTGTPSIDLNGVPQANTTYFAGYLPTENDWYLVVGYLTKPADGWKTGGLYNLAGQKLLTFPGFQQSGNNNINHRLSWFQSDHGYLWACNPRIEALDHPNFQTLEQLLFTQINLSSRAYCTTVNEAPSNQIYQPFIMHSPVFEDRAFNRELGIFGVSIPSWGAIRIDQNYKNIEDITEGSIIRIWEGSGVRSGFRILYDGFIDSIVRNDGDWTLKLRGLDLSGSICPKLYAGTNITANDLEGHPGDSIVGTPKPRCLGWCRPSEMIEPILVNSVGQIYQVDGYEPIFGSWTFSEELDDGTLIPWIYDGDHALLSSFNSSIPPSSHFSSHNALGIIRLGSVPVGKPRVTVLGPGIASSWTHAGILKSVLTYLKMPVTCGPNIEADTGKAFWYSTADMTIMDFLGRFLPSVGAYVGQTSDGLYVEKWNLPTTFSTINSVRVGQITTQKLVKVRSLKYTYGTLILPPEPPIEGVGGGEKDPSGPFSDLRNWKKQADSPGIFDHFDIDNQTAGVVVSSFENIKGGVDGGIRQSFYMFEEDAQAELDRVFDIVSKGGTYLEATYIGVHLPWKVNDGVTLRNQNWVVVGIQQLRRKENKIFLRSIE